MLKLSIAFHFHSHPEEHRREHHRPSGRNPALLAGMTSPAPDEAFC